MLNAGKRNVVGIIIDVVDDEGAVEFVMRAAHEKRRASISALAVHGLMTGVLDGEHKFRLNHFDLICPDGQPIRWALNWLYGVGLKRPVIGRDLTSKVCARAATEGIPVYFYGNTAEVLEALDASLRTRFPGLKVAGMEPSKFRRLHAMEREDLVARICASGAAILFVGLGCPKQETFAFEYRDALPMPILAVGAAFPFLAGRLAHAPQWMQDHGLEWLFRLSLEPRRLWRRYLFLNPTYLFLVVAQAIGLIEFRTKSKQSPTCMFYG